MSFSSIKVAFSSNFALYQTSKALNNFFLKDIMIFKHFFELLSANSWIAEA